MRTSTLTSGRVNPAIDARRLLVDFVLNVRPPGASASALPASFFVEPSYWGRPGAQDDWVLRSGHAVWQRLIVTYGLNLYCAACRQIALATTGRADALEAAVRHTELLLDGKIGDFSSLRGWSDYPGQWRYGDAAALMPASGGSAFFFSAVCERWRLEDPVAGRSRPGVRGGGAPLTWNFYDPFLGENSWAALIGPLQVAWSTASGSPIAADSAAIRLACSLLPACRAMQSTVGGIYARPARDGGEQERLVSNETNLTLYAGLTMLAQLLRGMPGMTTALAQVDSLRQGLLRYFRRYLCGQVEGELRIHACGTFLGDDFRPGVLANGEPAAFAADVHTWGMSILGVVEMDSRYGHGTCHRLWQSVKRLTGYRPETMEGPLRGVGFSSGHGGEPRSDVCSPEWTFGAINMCRILAAEYDAPGPHHDRALADAFRDDARAMLDGVETFEAVPATDFPSRAYLYVNRVTDTGFGWNALPVPSLCATAWAILVDRGFNPFQLGGALQSVRHDEIPPTHSR